MISLTNLLKNKDSSLINVIFYFLCVTFIISIFIYSTITLKVYLQTQRIDELNKRVIDYGLYKKTSNEDKIIDYKKKIDDFSLIVKNHKISSNVFNFIEENTLPNVWFANFDMFQDLNEIKLSGEAENIEVLGNQIQIFERNKDQVVSASILNSVFDTNGRIKFVLSISLNPKIYNYIKK